MRSPEPADLEVLLRWRNSPEVGRWLMQPVVEPSAYRRDLLSENGGRDHDVVAVRDGAVVGTGWVGVRDGIAQDTSDRPHRDLGMIGYVLDPAHAGQGLATELARDLLAVAFDVLGVRRVTAGCYADNTASWRVMEKLGMRREQHGVADSWHADRGWVDGFTYALLREEWVAQRGR